MLLNNQLKVHEDISYFTTWNDKADVRAKVHRREVAG